MQESGNYKVIFIERAPVCRVGGHLFYTCTKKKEPKTGKQICASLLQTFPL